MDVKTKALQQALKMLDAVGATYKVVMPSGEQYGALECVVKSGRPTRIVRPNIFAKTGYIDRMKNMHSGEVEVFTPPEGADAEQMRSAVCGSAVRIFGAGNFKTSISNNCVEVLRF